MATVPHAPAPSTPDSRRASCTVCGRRLMFVRRTGGPNGRKAHWQHVGDGLVQYASWGVKSSKVR